MQRVTSPTAPASELVWGVFLSFFWVLSWTLMLSRLPAVPRINFLFALSNQNYCGREGRDQSSRVWPWAFIFYFINIMKQLATYWWRWAVAVTFHLVKDDVADWTLWECLLISHVWTSRSAIVWEQWWRSLCCGPQNCCGGLCRQTVSLCVDFSFSFFSLIKPPSKSCWGCYEQPSQLLWTFCLFLFNPCPRKMKNFRYCLEKHLQLNLGIIPLCCF